VEVGSVGSGIHWIYSLLINDIFERRPTATFSTSRMQIAQEILQERAFHSVLFGNASLNREVGQHTNTKTAHLQRRRCLPSVSSKRFLKPQVIYRYHYRSNDCREAWCPKALHYTLVTPTRNADSCARAVSFSLPQTFSAFCSLSASSATCTLIRLDAGQASSAPLSLTLCALWPRRRAPLCDT